MKELLLFRTFVLFPFIGIAGPDMANALHASFASLPAEHIIVDTTLALCLVICSAGIWFFETMELKTSARNKHDYNDQHMPVLAGHEA
jgi:hypothetical protein